MSSTGGLWQAFIGRPDTVNGPVSVGPPSASVPGVPNAPRHMNAMSVGRLRSLVGRMFGAGVHAAADSKLSRPIRNRWGRVIGG